MHLGHSLSLSKPPGLLQTAIQRILALSPSGQVFLNEGIDPLHWFDFVADRCLYDAEDVGGVSGATGYSFSRASQGYYTNADGTLTSFASGALRRGDRGVLIEGARTNYALHSGDMSNAVWALTNATRTTGVSDPNGGTSAITVSATAPNGQIAQTVGGSLGTGTTYTGSIWARRRTGSGTVSLFNPNGGGLTAITLTSSWQRFSVTGLGAASNNFLGVRFATSGDEADFWFPQLEVGAFPSSYIPTTSVSATRAADVLTCTAGVSYPLSLWAEFERAVDTGLNESLVALEASSTDRCVLRTANSDIGQILVVDGGVTVANPTAAAVLAVGTPYKLAARVSTDSVQIARGATLGTEDTSATMPDAPTTLRIGSIITGASDPPFGYIRRAAIIPSALSDAQLQAVTT